LLEAVEDLGGGRGGVYRDLKSRFTHLGEPAYTISCREKASDNRLDTDSDIGELKYTNQVWNGY